MKMFKPVRLVMIDLMLFRFFLFLIHLIKSNIILLIYSHHLPEGLQIRQYVLSFLKRHNLKLRAEFQIPRAITCCIFLKSKRHLFLMYHFIDYRLVAPIKIQAIFTFIQCLASVIRFYQILNSKCQVRVSILLPIKENQMGQN